MTAETATPPAVAPGFTWVVRDALAVTKRNVLRNIRNPQFVVFSTIQPIMFVLLFAFVFGGAIAIPGVEYLDFLIPGIIVQTTVFGATNTAIGLAEDLGRGMIDRFRSLPMARSAVLAGRTLADTARNLFVVTLMIGVGYLLGFRFRGGIVAALTGILVVLLFGYAFSWIFAFVGLKAGDVETAQAAGFVWVFPLVFASSAFVPTQTMPGWLQAFAQNQPVTAVVDAARALTLGSLAPAVGLDNTAELVLKALGWVALVLVVAIPVGVRQYRKTI